MKLLRRVFMVAIFWHNCSYAEPSQTIRIAIIDNLMSQKLASEAYVRDYLDGVVTGVDLGKTKHINIQWKAFLYDRKPLSIFKEIHKVIVWNPDVIIGPRSSDKFLLLKNYFKDILVISPLASSPEIAKLPENFHSLVLPDNFSARVLINYIKKYFPDKKIVIITEADCNSCQQMSSLITNLYTHLRAKDFVNAAQFISDEVEEVPIGRLLPGNRDEDIIILLGTSYSSGILISRITNYLGHLGKINPIYIGNDQWGSWPVSYAGKVNARFPYEAYRISPQLINKYSEDYKNFEILFPKIFHAPPPGDTICYHAFHTITSIMVALNKNKVKQPNMRKKILSGYINIIKTNKYAFMPTVYEVYKLSHTGESKKMDITVETNL